MTQKLAKTKFIYYYLCSQLAINQFNILSTGSTFGRINLKLIRRLSILIPKEIDEQERIVSILDEIVCFIKSLESKLHNLQRIKTGLMQDLLSGEVSITPLLEG